MCPKSFRDISVTHIARERASLELHLIAFHPLIRTWHFPGMEATIERHRLTTILLMQFFLGQPVLRLHVSLHLVLIELHRAALRNLFRRPTFTTPVRLETF